MGVGSTWSDVVLDCWWGLGPVAAGRSRYTRTRAACPLQRPRSLYITLHLQLIHHGIKFKMINVPPMPKRLRFNFKH